MTFFTRCINVRNVNSALGEGIRWLLNRGHEEPSRNGPVLVSPDPVITCYEFPTERVLFSPMRDANPFFHFMEGLWMLGGRNDVAWISQFNGRFREYSDNGDTFWGAYGFRWRRHFGYDQLDEVIQMLKNNPKDRRVVLSMWDAEEGDYMRAPADAKSASDLHVAQATGSRDVPCNTNVFFKIVHNKLHMMVNNRSNDIIWGAYGANAVHMSMMLEFIATAVGVEVGQYWQSSWNFHAYTDIYNPEQLLLLSHESADHDLYARGDCVPYPMMRIEPVDWLDDLEDFLDGEQKGFEDPFFPEVAVPMFEAWQYHKMKNYPAALDCAEQIQAHDWRMACKAWLNRRAETKRLKEMRGGQS